MTATIAMIYTVTIEPTRRSKPPEYTRKFETRDMLDAMAALVDASRHHEKAHTVTITARPD